MNDNGIDMHSPTGRPPKKTNWPMLWCLLSGVGERQPVLGRYSRELGPGRMARQRDS